MSHLRFGPSPIDSEYMITEGADYIACHHPSYVTKYNMLYNVRPGGTFVMNSPWGLEEMEQKLPPAMKRQLAENKVQFYNIDASQLAIDVGLGNRINTIMQTVFYQLSGVLPREEALQILKDDIAKQFFKKGEKVIGMNQAAVDQALAKLTLVETPAAWATLEATERQRSKFSADAPKFVTDIMDPVLALEGDALPVSAFTAGGYMPAATTQ